MNDDNRIREMLEEILDSGALPEEVCADFPHLLPELRERLKRLKSLADQIDELFPSTHPRTAGSRPTRNPPLEASLPQIDGYDVEGLLGHGGMGVVYRARHHKLKRVVALKMLLSGAHASPQELARFVQEAEAVAGLQHPHIVQVHDAGELEGRPYFTMELVAGGSLAEKLESAPLSARQAALMVVSLADAVQLAHQHGIIHRDLKPANILLTGDGTPKIADFGLARYVDAAPELTASGARVGTPSYMAPEQALGKQTTIGPSVDIYALGATLYECVTGRPPFKANSPLETLVQVVHQEPAPPRQLNAQIPRDLETICLKCLQKDPRQRYATMQELADDLNHFLRGEAIMARPEGPLARLVRKVRRRPSLAAAVATGTLFTIVLSSAGLWFLAERRAAAREMQADKAATERAASQDLTTMEDRLRQRAWPEAKAALERARGRLGAGGSAASQRRLVQGIHDLELAARLDKIRLNGADGTDEPVKEYSKTFAEAGLGRVGDDPTEVALRIRDSSIRQALVDAFDLWALWAEASHRGSEATWALGVARHADPDPQGWRDRFRDPAVRKSKQDLSALADSVDLDQVPVNQLIVLGELLNARGGDAVSFARKIQQRHPDDLWANFFVAHVADNPTDALQYYRAALAIRPGTPFLYYNLGYSNHWAGRFDEAVHYFEESLRLDPNFPKAHASVSGSLLELDRIPEALEHIRQGLALGPNTEIFRFLKSNLKRCFLKERRWEDAQTAWRVVLDTNPTDHGDVYGYAELCLFLGQADEYQRAREALLARFGTATDPYIAERVARACLLMPASGDVLQKAAALAHRAASVDQSKHQGAYPYFQFVHGLAEYRKGRLNEAISVMRGGASRALGPAPRLVLAMALHASGDIEDARTTLAAAVQSYNWGEDKVHDQDGWIVHILRREADALISSASP